MSKDTSPTVWQRWMQQPKRLWFRRALFQIHLWSAVSLGLYIFFISITGSVLVYRNELYVFFSPDEQSSEAFANASAYNMVTTLIELHKAFLVGPIGKTINGIAAFGVLVVALTGFVIWWPGIKRWRRSLRIHSGVGWKRFVWDLHSMIGFWSFGFIFVFAFSGIYLCFPEMFHELAEKIQPMTYENAGRRFVDSLLYWLAFLHFGRINGIGILCSGPGVCDQSVKAIWALFGLAPAAMFVTGMTMWWNRVLRRWLRR